MKPQDSRPHSKGFVSFLPFFFFWLPGRWYIWLSRVALWGGCFRVTELSVAACSVAACHACKNVCEVKKPENCGLVPKKGLRSLSVRNDRAQRTSCTQWRPCARQPAVKLLGLWAVNKLVLLDFFYQALEESTAYLRGKKHVCALPIFCPDAIPRLQLAWNLNFPGKLINPHNFQGRLVKTFTRTPVMRFWRHLQWKCLVSQSTRGT